MSSLLQKGYSKTKQNVKETIKGQKLTGVNQEKKQNRKEGRD